jgi:hypothetical protein
MNTTNEPVVISFRCKPELRAAIERQAAAEGLSASAIVRRAVEAAAAWAQPDAGRSAP